MKRTLIRCGDLVSMDDGIGDLRDAEMLIGEDHILAIGKRLDAAHDELIDASTMIAMPGLVNMHLHTFQTGLRAFGSEWTPADYFTILYGDIATRFTPQDNYLGTLAGALNQLDCGVTTLFDYCHNLRSLEQAEASAEALEQSGIRAVFGHGDGIKPPGTPGAPAAEKRLHPRDRAQALRQGRFASDDRRVTMALAIAGPHWADWETSLHNARLGKELGLLVSSHVTKPRQLAVVPDGYERLAALGLLGEDHNLVHCNFLEREEIARLVGTGASITTTNLAELHDHASGPATLRVVQGGGLPSLGGDVEAMTTADMFREMQAALLHARHQSLREASATGAVPTAIPIRSRRPCVGPPWAGRRRCACRTRSARSRPARRPISCSCGRRISISGRCMIPSSPSSSRPMPAMSTPSSSTASPANRAGGFRWTRRSCRGCARSCRLRPRASSGNGRRGGPSEGAGLHGRR
ncbi:Cytosine/adenosine deaminase [Rhizobiales bacterium GAS191]|nr:Cytosine/adenosine deaminase [Rhizobiales bacterium GAS191]